MDFFDRQEVARKKTTLLVVLFTLAVAGIIVTIYSVIAGALVVRSRTGRGGDLPVEFWDAGNFAAVTLGVLAVVSIASLSKIAMLRGGGHVVAESLGGRRIPTDTTVFEERRLLNVVEEMAIASGVPVPPVFVLEDQHSINAFAAGYGSGDAVIAVTDGMLRGLTRDELQGVVAHEFSHILNGDMRLNIRLMGVIFGILVLAIVGRSVLRGMRFHGGRRDSKGGGVVAVIFLVAATLFVVGYIGVFFGKLIKSAVSRQREFLADASAVQFTRNPTGFVEALKKIGGLHEGSRINHPRAEEASHMYFGNGLKGSSFAPFATHPPLAERIRRIDASFDGSFPRFVLPPPLDAEAPEAAAASPSGADLLPPALLFAAAADPETILEQIGKPMLQHVSAVRMLLDEIPGELLETAHEPYGARAVVYALLLDDRPDVRRKQLEVLDQRADPTVFKLVEVVRSQVVGLPLELRVPLLDIAIYALRSLSESQYEGFRRNVDRLIEADREVSDFEFTLRRLLIRHLDSFFAPARHRAERIRSLGEVTTEANCVLSALARAGSSEDAAAVEAFRRAAISLDREFEGHLLPAEQCRLEDLDSALDRLASTVPPLKRRIVSACLVVLVHDDKIGPREALLFRAITDALDVPVPPILEVVRTARSSQIEPEE